MRYQRVIETIQINLNIDWLISDRKLSDTRQVNERKIYHLVRKYFKVDWHRRYSFISASQTICFLFYFLSHQIKICEYAVRLVLENCPIATLIP